MGSRAFSILMQISLFISILTLVFNVQPASAEWTGGTIYIRADGSIDPPSVPIRTYDNITYMLTGDININVTLANGIVVERNNIVIDGAGYTLRGIELGQFGIYLSNRNNVTIKNIKIKGFAQGIRLDSSTSNIIIGNIIKDTNHGVLLYSSANNIITGNVIRTFDTGIVCYESTDNTIIGNTIISYFSIIISHHSTNNIIAGNTITNGRIGIILTVYSTNNAIVGNTVAGFENGVSMEEESSNNKFYHNNFIDNDLDVCSRNLPNYWNDSYPSGGNYWSHYIGVDSYSGPYQNEMGSDGIGDTPYVIDSNNIDYYPLMKPWPNITVRVETSTETGIAEFTPSSGVIISLEPISEDTLPIEGKPDLEFPHGFFTFTIKGLAHGEQVTVTIKLPSPLPANSQYWKCQNGRWYEIPLGSNDGDEIITITLKDGGVGDVDGEANGVIVDPGAPGYPKPPVGGVIVSPVETQKLTTPYSMTLSILTILITATIIIVTVRVTRKRSNN